MLPQGLQETVNKYIECPIYKTRLNLIQHLSVSDYSLYDKRFIAVYGSLRKGEYNFHKLRGVYGVHELVFVADCKITGYKLVEVTNFPAAVYTDNAKDVLECQIMYVTERMYRIIKDMELAAGYELYSEIAEVDMYLSKKIHVKLDLFVATPKLEDIIADRPVISSGNWSDYLRETHAEEN